MLDFRFYILYKPMPYVKNLEENVIANSAPVFTRDALSCIVSDIIKVAQ